MIGQVRLVGGEHKAARQRFGRDHPAMDEFLVERESRRDDANDLRDIRRDQLFVKGIGAVDEARPRRHRFDRAAARNSREPHAIAARDLHRAPFEHAFQDLAVRERHRIMPPVRGDDEAFFRGAGNGVAARGYQANRRSALAAQMTSFSVTPPALCVENATTQRL